MSFSLVCFLNSSILLSSFTQPNKLAVIRALASTFSDASSFYCILISSHQCLLPSLIFHHMSVEYFHHMSVEYFHHMSVEYFHHMSVEYFHHMSVEYFHHMSVEYFHHMSVEYFHHMSVEYFHHMSVEYFHHMSVEYFCTKAPMFSISSSTCLLTSSPPLPNSLFFISSYQLLIFKARLHVYIYNDTNIMI